MLSILARGALGAAALLAVTAASSAQTPEAPQPPNSAPHAAAHGSAEPAYRIGSLTIESPWSRATPGGAKVAGGYMRITNSGSEPDRLIGGSFVAAGRFELHRMSVTDGVMRMSPVEHGVEIKPGETVELAPGGNHAMLLDLKRPLKEGETLSGTLRFEKAGTVAIDYVVRSIGAQGPGAAHDRH
jgi:copper(I)-binding protein